MYANPFRCIATYEGVGHLIRKLANGDTKRNARWLAKEFRIEPDPALKKLILISLAKLLKADTPFALSQKTYAVTKTIITVEEIIETQKWKIKY